MKRNKMMILVMLTASVRLSAQESLSPVISVVPPSPEVVSMNKFTEIPVSYYTGLPQITIPIHTLLVGVLTVPISLDYHASGLRVSEYASRVGAGWSLNGGGVISRTIRGHADERIESDYKGYFYSDNWMNIDGTINVSVLYDCSGDREFTSVPNTPDGYTPLNPSDYLAGGYWDTEPDRYNYSYPGGGGKFIFNHKRELLKLTASDIQINHPFGAQPSNNTYQFDYYWSIETPDGTKYIYGYLAERTTTSNPCTTTSSDAIPMPDYSNTTDQSSWFLTRIENMNDYINYNYSAETINETIKITESNKVKLQGPGSSSESECQSTRSRNTYRLNSITTSNGYSIIFTTGSSRLDLAGSNILDRIEIKFQGNILKTYDLKNNGYFGNNAKLKLDGVDILDPNDVLINKYQLEYFSGSFPDHDTPQQDYWGYYNGALGNNASMIPEWWNEDYHVNINTSTDRNPSLNHTIIGTLKKITYPTGGHAEFDYELHDYSGSNTFKSFSYEVQADGEEFNTDTDEVLFTVNQDCSISMIYGGIPDGLDAFAGIKKWNSVNQQYESYTPADRPGFLLGTTAFRKDIEAGSYKLWAESWGAPIDLEINFEETGNVKFQRAGGLRVKKISHYDPLSDSYFHSIFDYTPKSQDVSSGRLLTKYINDGFISSYQGGDMGQSAICIPTSEISHYLNLSSYVQVPLATVSGSHVGYSEVKVHKISDSDLSSYTPPPSVNYRPEFASLSESLDKLGLEIFKYINDYPRTDTLEYSYDYPYVRVPDLDSKNGKLIKQEVYGNVGGSLTLQKEVINEYDTLKTSSIRSYLFRRTISTYCYECSAYPFMVDNSYVDFGKKLRLTKTTEGSYENGEQHNVEVYYEYDYPNHHEVAATNTTLSNGDISRVEFSRDEDNPLLITQINKFLNGTQVSGDSLQYVSFRPGKYFKWRIGGQYDLRQVISRDADNLVVQIERPSLSGGASIGMTSYLYSHQNAHKVVAEIQNIDTVELEAMLVSINSNYSREWLKSQNDSVLISSVLNSLRSILGSHQFIRTFTYSPATIGYGPSKIADENGISQTFDYDDAGRLSNVYDNDNNLVKKITYNFKNN